MAGESPAQLGGPLSGLVPGSRLGGYLLERLVGVGGMAAVYQARDERLGRVVALKLLAGDEALRKRFVREARAVAAVDHPHIIPVYEAGEADGVQFIAMRFVAGGILQGVIRDNGALAPRRAAAFISQVASALDAPSSRLGAVHVGSMNSATDKAGAERLVIASGLAWKATNVWSAPGGI